MSDYDEYLIHRDWDLLARIHDAVNDFLAQTGLRPNVIRLSTDLYQRWRIGGTGNGFEGCPVEGIAISLPDTVHVLRETFETWPWNLPTVPWDVPATSTPLKDIKRIRGTQPKSQ